MVLFALKNLLSRPVRSLLAWLGLTVAIMGMVGLFSVAAGMHDMIDRTFGQIPGLLAMQPGAPIPLLSRLPSAWADEIAALPGVRTVCREQWSRAHLVDGKPTFNTPRFLFGADIVGLTRLKKSVYRDALVEGRFLTLDDRGHLRTVISRDIAKERRKGVGEVLRVDGFDLEIVGIYETNSMFLNVAILVDGDLARRIAPQDPAIMSSAYIEPDGTVPKDQLVEQIREHFRGRGGEAAQAALHPATGNALADFAASIVNALTSPRLPNSSETSEVSPPSHEEGLEVRTAVDWGERVQEFSSDLDLFLFLINLIGVAIALLSILNTMLMSVTERLVEFGVLRANGWSRRNVIHLILAESAVLGLAGGVSGCLLGVIGTHVVNWWFPSKAHLYASPALLVASLAFSTLLGMMGGLYPAWWAVRQSPMEAIRRG
jgi:putative ABC transport system permease protein